MQFPSLSHRIFTDLASVPEHIWVLCKLPYISGTYREDFQRGSQLPLLILYLSRNWDLLPSLLPTLSYKEQLAMEIYDNICHCYYQATLGKDPKGPSVKAKMWCLSYREKEIVKLPSSHLSKVEGRWLLQWDRVKQSSSRAAADDMISVVVLTHRGTIWKLVESSRLHCRNILLVGLVLVQDSYL